MAHSQMLNTYDIGNNTMLAIAVILSIFRLYRNKTKSKHISISGYAEIKRNQNTLAC